MRPLFALLLFVSASGCQLFGPDARANDPERFAYIARDSDGAVVAEGTLFLSFAPASDDSACPSCALYTVSGSRSIDTVSQSAHRLLSSNAAVDGVVQADSTVYLSLMPPIPDLGFELTGRFDGEMRGSFSGTWAPCGFGGCTAGGTFTATR